jgi:hypothetical protein
MHNQSLVRKCCASINFKVEDCLEVIQFGVGFPRTIGTAEGVGKEIEELQIDVMMWNCRIRMRRWQKGYVLADRASIRLTTLFVTQTS